MASNIARWDGKTWSALEYGVNDTVRGLAANDGYVYVGGAFSVAGNAVANHIARWDGKTWTGLGEGVNDDVFAISARGSDLYAGGRFTMAGGIPANYVAKWDSKNWTSLGSGVDGSVLALSASDRNVFLGGNFQSAGGKPSYNIGLWHEPSCATVPDKPTLVSPKKGEVVKHTRAVLDWHDSHCADSYRLSVRADSERGVVIISKAVSEVSKWETKGLAKGKTVLLEGSGVQPDWLYKRQMATFHSCTVNASQTDALARQINDWAKIF